MRPIVVSILIAVALRMTKFFVEQVKWRMWIWFGLFNIFSVYFQFSNWLSACFACISLSTWLGEVISASKRIEKPPGKKPNVISPYRVRSHLFNHIQSAMSGATHHSAPCSSLRLWNSAKFNSKCTNAGRWTMCDVGKKWWRPAVIN